MDEQKKDIGRGELICLNCKFMYGTGIFGITSDVAAAAAPGPALLAWIFVGIGFLMLVLSLNNLSEKRPDLTSGIFSYAGAGFGPLCEFYFWMVLLVVRMAGKHCFCHYVMSSIGTFFPTFKVVKIYHRLLLPSSSVGY